MRAVLVDQGNTVLTAVELAPDWQTQDSPNHWDPPAGVQVVFDDKAGKGWSYNGSVFTPPPPNPDPPPPSAAELSAADDGTLANFFNGAVGSVDRAALRVLFKVIKGTIPVPQASLTPVQFLGLLKNEIR